MLNHGKNFRRAVTVVLFFLVWTVGAVFFTVAKRRYFEYRERQRFYDRMRGNEVNDFGPFAFIRHPQGFFAIILPTILVCGYISLRYYYRQESLKDQLEQALEKLGRSERSRAELLREMSHDLRTPLTSLHLAIHRLDGEMENLSGKPRERLRVAKTEIAYFQRLLENLFFIAQQDSPEYSIQTEIVDLWVFIEEEVLRIRSREGDEGRKEPRVVLASPPEEELLVQGEKFLLSRLLRNALDNAWENAESLVTVSVEKTADTVQILIANDGLAISAQGLKQFGKRRSTRYLDASSPAKVSLGLGSVIMKRITELHHGNLVLQSPNPHSASLRGALLSISLPLATGKSGRRRASA